MPKLSRAYSVFDITEHLIEALDKIDDMHRVIMKLKDYDEPLLTVSELAEKAQMNPDSIRHLVKEGKLAHYRIGNRIRVKMSDFRKEIKN